MCSVAGCTKTTTARGLCPMHYRRLRLYGDPLARQVVRGDDEGRFWSHVEKTPGCWLWSGALTHDGYGRFRMPDGHVMAHRFAYELLVGPIPEGLVLDHVRARGCVHRHCVRPDHLEPVTNEVNLLRGDTFVAENAAKSHCPAEHPYDEANTIRRNGRRICRTCEQARAGQPAGR